MRQTFGVLGAGTMIVVGLAVSAAPTIAQDNMVVRAPMIDAQNRSAGEAVLTQMAQGVLIRLDLTGLEPGWHAIHIHENGVCEPPFSSAGGHLDPHQAKHGVGATEGPHAGDLPNVHASDDGSVRAELFSERIALIGEETADRGLVDRALGAIETAAGGRAANILGGSGVALVVHARPDDHRTGPSGDSGDRVACGVVKRN
jgi:Cu-Zn family superoxide dismutase